MNLSETPGPAAEQRHHMIEEAAYYRAERRGFTGGDPMSDWLEAEAEIDHVLHEEPSKTAGDARKAGPIEQFAAQLQELDEQIGRFASKAWESQAELREELAEELEKLRPLRTVAEEKLGELRERSGEAWEEVRKGVDKAREDLSSALATLTKRWR